MGLPVASFTGAYASEAGVPLVVDEVQKNEFFSADFPQVVPAAKLPKLSFQANHYVPGKRPHEMTVSFGEFTLAGPKAESLKPLPARVSRVTYDPGAKKYYGIADHGVALIDLEKQKSAKLDLGLGVPPISWPADVTFDTKRERLVADHFRWRRLLVRLLPEDGEMGGGIRATTRRDHLPPEGRYALRPQGRRRRRAPAHQREGRGRQDTEIAGPLLPGMLAMGPGVSGVQLIPADDKLVMLVAPVGLRGDSERIRPAWNYIYLIDPKTGKAQLTWKSK